MRYVRILALIGVTIGIAVLVLRAKRGPTYSGKPLTMWLVELQSTNRIERNEAEMAVRAIGTNALPTLLTWLCHRDSSVEKSIRPYLGRIGLSTGFRFSEDYYQPKAMCGFRTLGSLAQPAIPQLRTLVLSSDPRISRNASHTLAWVSIEEAEALCQEMAPDTNRAGLAQNLRAAIVIAKLKVYR